MIKSVKILLDGEERPSRSSSRNSEPQRSKKVRFNINDAQTEEPMRNVLNVRALSSSSSLGKTISDKIEMKEISLIDTVDVSKT
jgi:hypothetical protein